tara:strand:- start:102249 stop:103157 length:909 start_codon:yes stop_codon:yes gene_type:complete
MLIVKYLLSLFLFFLLSLNTKAQLLDANKQLFDEDPFFNEKFIKINKIKSIKGSWSSKKVKDIIRKKNVDFYYEFNENGMLQQQYSTFLSQNIKKDTSVIAYTYNSESKIIVKRKTDNNGFFSLTYDYDAKGNLLKETYAREENASNTKNDFSLKKQYIIKTDSFHFEKLSKNQEKITYYNSYGKSYKETFYYYDELGYLSEVYTKYLIGNKKSKITYKFNETGRLGERTTHTDLNKDLIKKEEFIYDEIGNLMEIKTYENNEYKTSTQFLYDKNMLMTAQLTKVIATEFLTIIQYEYSFYE